MNHSKSNSYAAAGVDVTAGYEAVRRMKKFVESTYTEGVVGGIGGFGGLFRPDFASMEDPILVSGTDGVGTKLKIAFLMDKHDTIGIDCVAMCANDIACTGARPLFFLDYLALGKNRPKKVAEIVSGVAAGCREAGLALIGGESAEMPGFYPEDEYDLAGFAVGMVDRKKMIDGSQIVPGDALIGLASSGLHSNGFSLVRKVLGVGETSLSVYHDELGCTLGEELLRPTRIYVKSLNALTDTVRVKGISNITGGGFYENIPRMLPEGTRARVHVHSFPLPPIFSMIERIGNIPTRDMYNTFNMGIGIVLAVAKDDLAEAVRALTDAGEHPYTIGSVVEGEHGVEIC